MPSKPPPSLTWHKACRRRLSFSACLVDVQKGATPPNPQTALFWTFSMLHSALSLVLDCVDHPPLQHPARQRSPRVSLTPEQMPGPLPGTNDERGGPSISTLLSLWTGPHTQVELDSRSRAVKPVHPAPCLVLSNVAVARYSSSVSRRSNGANPMSTNRAWPGRGHVRMTFWLPLP